MPEQQAKEVAQAQVRGAYKIVASDHVTTAWGSGFLTQEGIITAKHVISLILIPGTANIPVWAGITVAPLMDSNQSYHVKPHIVSKDYDVAALDSVPGPLKLPWGKAEALAPGDPVILLSAPQTSDDPMLAYASLGQVQALSTESPATFRYTIPVEPGSSGGAVLNMTGEVVGINVMRESSENQAYGVGIKSEAIQAALAGKVYNPPAEVIIEHEILSPIGIALGGAALLLLLNQIQK